MKLPLRVTARLLRIQSTLLRHGLDDLILPVIPYWPVRWILTLLSWRWRRRYTSPMPVRIRLALEDLGPVFIKFGQVLSTRPDLLPSDIAYELAQLQDRVPPFDGELARAEIEQALGRPVQELYEQFDPTPLASASIAQVHQARLNGIEVIIKVLRPGVEDIIRRDIELMYALARLAERYWTDSHRFHPVRLVAEYEHTIFDELDLNREAANASQLRRNFEDTELLYVPEVYWDYTAQRVMTMERINGIHISDREELTRCGINLKLLAERGVEIFFTQVFHHNFFHADMHPGNIFISRETPHSPRYSAVDFGIMGSLSDFDQRYLALNFAAFFNRDYRKVAELHVQSGWVPEGTRVEEFEAAIRTVCEPIFQRPFAEISFARLLMRLFQTARRFNMEVQPQLALLQKTLFNIEGLGRELYPNLDLWSTAKPFMDQWVREHTGLPALSRTLRTHLPQLISRLLIDEPQVSNTTPPEAPPVTRRALKGWQIGILLILGASGWLAYLYGSYL